MAKDIIGGLVILAFSITYYFQAGNIRRSTMADEVGAHGVPQAFAIFLAVLAILLIGQSVVARLKVAQWPTASAEERQKLRRSVLRMSGMLAIGIAYLIAVPVLGYALSIGLLLAVVMVYQGLAPSWRIVGVAVGGTIVFWIIFVLLLDIPLPAGIWANWV